MPKQIRQRLLRSLPFLAFVFTSIALPYIAPAKDQAIHTGPATIYIIRHGEKPETGKDPNLTPKGYQRADALAQTFPKLYGSPDFIWATAASKHSNRPMETVTPLARALHEPVQNAYADADFDKLAHELLTDPKYAGKTVLICWHHGEIPGLAKALGATDAPEKWKAEEFDRVWRLAFADGKIEFKNMPEEALPGDSQE